MTGGEILAVQEVGITCWHWGAFAITFVFILSVFIALGFATSNKRDRFGLIVSLIAGILLGGLFSSVTASVVPIGHETQYKVTISDEVSMNEFLERYEIIEQEGKIYTVREIEDGK